MQTLNGVRIDDIAYFNPVYNFESTVRIDLCNITSMIPAFLVYRVLGTGLIYEHASLTSDNKLATTTCLYNIPSGHSTLGNTIPPEDLVYLQMYNPTRERLQV